MNTLPKIQKTVYPKKHRRHLSMRRCAVAALWLGWPAICTAQDLVFPADAQVVNVKNPATFGAPAGVVGARGDGVADDTRAIRAAIHFALNRGDRYGGFPLVYLPRGTYKVSDALESRIADTSVWFGWRAGLYLVGESQTHTIVKLDDAAPGYANASTPKAVIKTGSEAYNGTPSADGGGNQAFRHTIQNLTVDVGANNLGAIGIDFLASNRGAIENVTIRSSDPARRGHTGIAMNRAWPGPALIKNVAVQGFDTGIALLNHYQYSMTFEHVALEEQKVAGIKTNNNVLNIRGLQSSNAVPVIQMTGSASHLVLLDARFMGGAPASAAITNAGKFYGRNLQSAGYGKVIDDTTSANQDIAGGAAPITVQEYKSHTVAKAFSDSANRSLQLPIEETPTYHTADLNQWANVLTFGATRDNSSNDDTAGIQAAIDSGKTVVYLPHGQYHVARTLVLRGNLRKLIGLHAGISRKAGFPSGAPLFRFDGGLGSSVVLENLRMGGMVEHNAARTLAIRHCDLDSYRNTLQGTGKLFLEDTIGPKPLQIGYGQKVWARQLNTEFGTATHIENRGGTLWVLGHKTEGNDATLLETTNQGATELLGGFFYPNGGDASPALPMVIDHESATALSYVVNYAGYTIHLRQTRNGTTQDLLRTSVPGRGNNSSNVTLATAFQNPPAPWTSQDVGLAGTAGSTHYLDATGTFRTYAAGAGIWGPGDAFHFVYQPINGDTTITAKVISLENTRSSDTNLSASSSLRSRTRAANTYPKAGVMIRESLSANSKHAFLSLTPSNGARFYARGSVGGSTSAAANPGIAPPYWVRLVRIGNTLTGYRSPDGATWTRVGGATVPLAARVYIGLATTSANPNALTRAQFGDVRVTTP